MILRTNDCGDLWRLDYNRHGIHPVNLYDEVYRVVVCSAEPPQFDGDKGTVNEYHNVDNLNLVWTLLEEWE
tara:strand:+ start:96 stop:308 length:213 start_codon:yes stop_codon:yes gene_type:complete